MRGLPGSGKSTFIHDKYPNAVICSADHYFLNDFGDYLFDSTKLGAAHAQCMKHFQDCLNVDDFNTLVIDNTNLTWREAGRYIESGLASGHDVELVNLLCDVGIAANRNIHGVPRASIEKMARRQFNVPKYLESNPKYRQTSYVYLNNKWEKLHPWPTKPQ
jgi:predicted kinase